MGTLFVVSSTISTSLGPGYSESEKHRYSINGRRGKMENVVFGMR